MALEIKNLQQAPVGAMYVATQRICVTSEGELCDEDDERAVRLLVAKGCEIPASEAALYGLIADEPDAAEDEDETAGLKKAELLELAAERGIEVSSRATVAEIREALGASDDE